MFKKNKKMYDTIRNCNINRDALKYWVKYTSDRSLKNKCTYNTTFNM